MLACGGGVEDVPAEPEDNVPPGIVDRCCTARTETKKDEGVNELELIADPIVSRESTSVTRRQKE